MSFKLDLTEALLDGVAGLLFYPTLVLGGEPVNDSSEEDDILGYDI